MSMMKESEAVQKLCPLGRTKYATSITETGETVSIEAVALCAGSKCMMWERSMSLGDNVGTCALKNHVVG